MGWGVGDVERGCPCAMLKKKELGFRIVTMVRPASREVLDVARNKGVVLARFPLENQVTFACESQPRQCVP